MWILHQQRSYLPYWQLVQKPQLASCITSAKDKRLLWTVKSTRKNMSKITEKLSSGEFTYRSCDNLLTIRYKHILQRDAYAQSITKGLNHVTCTNLYRTTMYRTLLHSITENTLWICDSISYKKFFLIPWFLRLC